MEIINKLKDKWGNKWEFETDNGIFIHQGIPIKNAIAYFGINKCLDFYFSKENTIYKNKFYMEFTFFNIDALLDILTNNIIEPELITDKIILSKIRTSKINSILNT